MAFTVTATTAEDMRREVVAYFDAELDRLQREEAAMKPKTERDRVSLRLRTFAARNSRDFFRDVTIKGTDK